MNNFNNDDLETFLIEAELISQKVKALAENTISPEEFDKQEIARANQKKRKEEAVIRKEREAYNKRKEGREGKGITKDFQHFCRFCHWEYEFSTPVCLRCNRETMTLDERQEQLTVMVDQYKRKKNKRDERKMKWDMWQKTKAMLWKKTSNNYEKWDYFVSDSEEEVEQEPIVPKDDPNFKALERDMEERKAERRKETDKAKKLKEKGNEAMKQGDYQRAMELYTLSLEHIRDIKSVYTNRALAFIKLKRYTKAIKDCTNVIEYMEVFEKAEENKDLMFKAHLRRALAKKERKEFKEALEDCQKALTYYPNDNSALIMKKEIEGFIEHHEKLSKLLREDNKNPESDKKPIKEVEEEEDEKEIEIKENLPNEEESKYQENQIIKELAEAEIENEQKEKNQNQPNLPKEQTKEEIKSEKSEQKEEIKTNKTFASPIEEIKERLEVLNEQNISKLFKILKQKPELVSVFIAAKGVQKCLNQLITSEESQKEGFLASYCLKGDGVGEREVWDFGISKLHSKIDELLQSKTELNMGKYFILEDIFEVLIPMSLHEKYRILLADSQETFNFLEKTFAQLITRHKKQPDLFSSFLIYMGNLCSGNSKLRDTFISTETLKIVVLSLFEKVLIKRTTNKSQLNLKKNIYSLYANLAINLSHRIKLIEIFKETETVDEKEISRWAELVKELKLYPKAHENFEEYILALMSLFANTTMGTSTNIENLSEVINERYLSNPSSYSPELINRALLIISRIKYDNPFVFKKLIKNIGDNLETFKKMKGDKNPMEHIVRLLNIMYMPTENHPRFSEPLPKNLLTELKTYISSIESGEILFCNTCNLFCVILDGSNESSMKLYPELKSNIVFLISIAKDKIGNFRKNASILLAKLSINPECKEELYKNHGMDVLKSIAQFVK